MPKCPQCRKIDKELLTRWEIFKNWCFRKLFPEDIADLSQDKYTQGFSDGYVRGMESGKEILKKLAKQIYGIEI